MEYLIFIYGFMFIALVFMYQGFFNLPVIFFSFYSIYNYIPFIGFFYFLGDTEWDQIMGTVGNKELLNQAFIYHFYGASTFFIVSVLSKLIWHEKNNNQHNLYKVKDDLLISSSLAFILIIAGVFVTGQIYGIGAYGTLDPARSEFAFLIHFTSVLFIVGSFYVYSCIIDGKLKYNLILLQFIVIILLYILIGNRGMIVGLVLILLYYVTHNRKNILRDFILVFFGYVALIAIQQLRNAASILQGYGIADNMAWIEGSKVILERVQQTKYLKDLLFTAQGDKIGIFTAIIEKVNETGFLYGYTYLESLPKLIPSIFRRPLDIPDHDVFFNFLGYLDDCVWCSFSLNGELYMNFGLYGIIIGLALIAVFFGFLHERSNINRPFTMIFMLNMFPFIINITRNSSDLNIKLIVYTFILTILLYIFHIKKIKKTE